MKYMKYPQGFIALTSVLIMSAIFLSITISIASRAIGGLDISATLIERDAARYFSEACTEHALLELQRTLDYAGNEGILVAEGSCEILPIGGSGNNSRTIQALSIVGSHTYYAEVLTQELSPSVVITSFDRVESF